MDIAGLADLLYEAEQHHAAYEASAPEHNWWEWYAAYVHAREQGATPDEASSGAGSYVAGLLTR